MAARRRHSKKAPPRLAKTYVVPFLDEDDAQMVGIELEKAAQAHQVNGIRHLDAEVIYDDVEKNKKHPFRRLAGLKWNDDIEAARRYRVGYIGKLISSVQVTVVTSNKRKTYESVYVSANAPVVKQGSQATRRSHINRHDAFSNDPAFTSYVNTQCKRIIQPLEKLEHTATSRPLPPEVQQFVMSVRAAANAAGLA